MSDDGQYIKVALTIDIPEGQVKVVDVDGEQVALCNVSGAFFAVADLCSHDDGPLGEGELDEFQIECPRHGARFDVRTGKALCLPAVMPIPIYEVEVRGNEVWVKQKAKSRT